MKKSTVLLSLLLAFGTIALSGCGKKTISSQLIHQKRIINKLNNPIANHHLTAINLGLAESFAVMAGTSITSIPNSIIKGKVGLKPGTRSLITLISTEVLGGESEIYAGDDNPLLNTAKADLITSYTEGKKRTPDSDKIGRYYGSLGDKVLPAGCYKWNSGVVVKTDLFLEGSASDVWLFQINGNFNVAHDVHIYLSGGAQAKNIFWLVEGNVLLDEKSVTVGTVISQKMFTMKSYALLDGRAFAINDKLFLDINTISRP